MPTTCRVHTRSTRADVALHKSDDDIWQIIHDRVYDVTKYLDDHPGGEEVLKDKGGMDATEDFEDVGHSNDARKTLARFEIGMLALGERNQPNGDGATGGSGGAGIVMMAVPVLLIAAAVGYFNFVATPAD